MAGFRARTVGTRWRLSDQASCRQLRMAQLLPASLRMENRRRAVSWRHRACWRNPVGRCHRDAASLDEKATPTLPACPGPHHRYRQPCLLALRGLDAVVFRRDHQDVHLCRPPLAQPPSTLGRHERPKCRTTAVAPGGGQEPSISGPTRPLGFTAWFGSGENPRCPPRPSFPGPSLMDTVPTYTPLLECEPLCIPAPPLVDL